MNSFIRSLPHQIKGFLIMGIGILLLLHTLGIIERGISMVLIIISAAIIAYGFIMTGYHKKFMREK